MEVGIDVAREGQRCEALLLDDDSQFLLQLADQALFRPLAGFDLAAGKLPQPAIDFPSGRCAMQHAAVGIDERAGGNKDEFDAHGLGSI